MEAQAQEAEILLARSSTKDDALQNAIRATELYISAAKLATGDFDKNRLQTKCKLLLSKAEEIKKSKNWPLATKEPSGVFLDAIVPSRKPSKQEELILLENSKLNGFVFTPWTTDPDDSAFERVTVGESYYIESIDLKLSEAQRDVFAGWIRSGEEKDDDSSTDNSALISSDMDVDLVQDITTDCSLVASLCAIVSRASKGHGQLMTSVFFPKNKLTGCPKISKNGKYICRLQFNGCFRKVTIDNRLPKSTTNRNLHVIDRKNPGTIWPALLEKAYLKVRGGYDFPGSNSGTDLWIILGWIPEQVFLQRLGNDISSTLLPSDKRPSDDFKIEHAWTRIFKAFNYGDVMITIGTGELTSKEEISLGLAGKHDYAILDLIEQASQFYFLVKNPWCDGMVWKGSIGNFSTKRNSSDNVPTVNIHEPLLKLPKTSTGTFWMSFKSISQHFEYMYLNWNPDLFRQRKDYHFNWNTSKTNLSVSFIHNPQYIVRSAQRETIWVLLSRHFSTEEQNIHGLHKKCSKGESSAVGYISLYAFETSGRKVYISDNAIYRGAFVDSPQTLARFDSLPSKTYIIVAAQHGLPLSKYSFTLTFFSRFPTVVDKVSEPKYHSSNVGAWNIRTAGGNASSPYYHKNPQYSISVSSTANIDLILEADQQDLAIHVSMIWAGGKRVTAVTSRDIVGDSGDYRRGCTLATLRNINAGKYTIVCSTFESGRTANFTLYIDSNVSCEVTPVLSETAGRLCFDLEPLTFPEGINRMLAPLKVIRLTRLTLVARCIPINQFEKVTGSNSLLKLSLERGQGTNKTVIRISGNGDFDNAPTGIRLKDIDLSPKTNFNEVLFIVVERLAGGKGLDRVEVEVLSNNPIEVGTWRASDG